MTKRVKLLLLAIGALSIVAGLYLAFTISDFSGIFTGAALIGACEVHGSTDERIKLRE